MKQAIRTTKRVLLILIISLLTTNFLMIDTIAEGIGVRISSNSSSVSQGQKITITVSPSQTTGVRNYDAVIRYNPDLVSFDPSQNYTDLIGADTKGASSPSAGMIIAVATRPDTISVENLFQLTFTTKNTVGTATFTVTEAEINTDYTASSKSVSVEIKKPASDDNKLSALSLSAGTSSVAISPGFNPDTYTYSATVGMGTSSVAVVATARHEEAVVSNVTGHQDLSYGRNEVKITVRAENGDTRTYTVNVTRTAPTPTPAATSTPTPSPTPEATPTPSPTPTPTPSPTPSPTPVPPVEIELEDGTTYVVSDLPEGVEMPAGFYRTVIQVDGRSVNAFKALQSELTLLYLTGPDGRSAFMVYDELQGAVYPYVQMTVPALSYTFVQPDDEIQIPAGFIETTLLYQGENLLAWRQDPNIYRQASDDVYLVYLMDEMGNKGFYIFNQTRGTMTPYPYTDLDTIDSDAETTPTETEEPEDEVAPADTSGIWKILTIAFGLIILILIGMIIWLLVKNRQDGGPPDDPYDDGYDDYHDPDDGDSFDDDSGYSEQSPDDDDTPPPPSDIPTIPPVKRV